jgi:hypothetical protein
MSQGDTGMDAIRVIRISLQVLGERAFSLLAMLMTFSLFCWAMLEPSYERLALVAFFALAVYIPSLKGQRKSYAETDHG